MILPALVTMLAQVGPNPAIQPSMDVPPELIEQRRRAAEAQDTPRTEDSRLVSCLRLASGDPVAGLEGAETWLATARGTDAAHAGHCKGLALVRLGRFGEAQLVFASAREAAREEQLTYRARLAAMGGNAAMAAGDPQAALVPFANAIEDARAAQDMQLAGSLEADSARAFVALQRPEDAMAALDRARQADPGSARNWLLSATLSRRLERLGNAQTQIERAAELDPRDPAIGLEAGVIAALAGRDEDARRSFEAVLLVAPESEEAERARGYLEQLGPAAE